MTTSITETKTAELINEALALYDIHKNGYFTERDLFRLNLIEQEIARRGYQITQSSKLAFERVK